MGTYIIHFDDKPWEDLDDELYYRCFEIPWFSTTKTTISRLTPYTEDSAYAHGYTEAESKYREIRDELEKQAYQKGYETAKHECEDCQKIRSDAEQELVKKAYDTAYADAEEIYESGKRAMYQKGLKDAWECARKIQDTGGNLKWWIHNVSASECIEKIRQYEQEKEEIKVGDEVKSGNERYVVLQKYLNNIDEPMAVLFNRRDEEISFFHLYNGNGVIFEKTGRHFPELVELLRKMKETDNG